MHEGRAPGDDQLEAVAFPPSWPTRPWIFGNVIASANAVVAWTRQGPSDDPLSVIAGGDFTHPGRLADVRLMHSLRAHADALSVGAETLRDHPGLMDAPSALGAGFREALSRFRASHRRRRSPILVVYSVSGRLNLGLPVFNTAGQVVIVVTTEQGARRLRAEGSQEKGITIVLAGDETIESAGLVRAHERLLSEFEVRHLDCEGGMVALTALRGAGILDEVFVTIAPSHVETAERQGIKRIFAFEVEGAHLIAEGRPSADTGYVFRRWRFDERR